MQSPLHFKIWHTKLTALEVVKRNYRKDTWYARANFNVIYVPVTREPSSARFADFKSKLWSQYLQSTSDNNNIFNFYLVADSLLLFVHSLIKKPQKSIFNKMETKRKVFLIVE